MHMALDVIELMKQMGVPKASVMGHSMGGRTMMFLALKYVSKFVCLLNFVICILTEIYSQNMLVME